MVAILKANDLRKLFSHLEKQITFEDLEWLKKVAPGFWDKYDWDNERHRHEKNTAWRKRELSDSVRISFLIQNIVDAKLRQFPRTNPHQDKDRETLDLCYADGMPKHYLMEIAEILGIEGFQNSHKYPDCNTNRFELAKNIMDKIG
jgi:hypothetical protein